jgi:hypothetical protein
MMPLAGRRAAILSYRLGTADGVSVTAAQWATALRRLGMHVTTVAGAGRADLLVEGLAIDALRPPSHARLAAALGDVDLGQPRDQLAADDQAGDARRHQAVGLAARPGGTRAV